MATEAVDKASSLTARELAHWILDGVGGGDWSVAAYARAERMIKQYEAGRRDAVNQSGAVEALVKSMAELIHAAEFAAIPDKQEHKAVGDALRVARAALAEIERLRGETTA